MSLRSLRMIKKNNLKNSQGKIARKYCYILREGHDSALEGTSSIYCFWYLLVAIVIII